MCFIKFRHFFRFPKKTKGNIILPFFALFILGLSGIFYHFVYSQGDPLTPYGNPLSQFQLCTGTVSLPPCLHSSQPRVRLNWTYSSLVYGQAAFWIQADQHATSTGGYMISPEINTGWIASGINYYDVPDGALAPNTAYYWKMAVADTNGSWSGWTCADATFTTPPACAVDCGLRFRKGAETISIACEPVGTVTSPLRINKGGTTYGIFLVPVSDPNASAVRIQTPTGVKALKKF